MRTGAEETHKISTNCVGFWKLKKFFRRNFDGYARMAEREKGFEAEYRVAAGSGLLEFGEVKSGLPNSGCPCSENRVVRVPKIMSAVGKSVPRKSKSEIFHFFPKTIPRVGCGANPLSSLWPRDSDPPRSYLNGGRYSLNLFNYSINSLQSL